VNSVLTFVTTTYNDAKYLHRLGRSISSSTKLKHDWIVVNDGSTDLRSLSNFHSLKSYGDNQNLIKISIPNAGLASARNVGINQYDGGYIRFVDSDDYLVPLSTDYMISKLEEDVSSIVIGDYFLWNENQETLTWPVRNNSKISLTEWKSLAFSWELAYTIPIHSALFKNLDISFQEGMRNKEDWVFWSSMSRSTKQISVLDYPVCGYVLHEKNMSSERTIATCLAWLDALDKIANIYPEGFREAKPLMFRHFLKTYWDRVEKSEKSFFLSPNYPMTPAGKKLYLLLKEFNLV
jgi:glycosyltransferase involved in cell wall biosynthesis